MEVFGPAILLGAGSSTLLVTSLSMVADLIGPHSVHKFTYFTSFSLREMQLGDVIVIVTGNL